ncbi:MAG: peptidylprolyl isomerase, partial [Microbacterium sp.]
TATFVLEKGGSFEVELFPDKAPKAVNSFVFLARDHFYDGTTFHRVIDGFMAQGGDPTNVGGGDAGYEFEIEPSDLGFDKPGVVALANTGLPNSNGSQFFITFAPQEYLNGGYSIFGQVTEGMDVVNGITRREPNPSLPAGDAIKTVTITEK